MTAFDGLRNTDDPGLLPPPDALPLDVQIRRHSPAPDRAMMWICRAFWMLFWGALAAAILVPS